VGLGFLATVRADGRPEGALGLVRQHVIAERGSPNPWPSFEEDVVFELTIARCLLTLTQPDGFFPQGPTRLGGGPVVTDRARPYRAARS
jgi:hypothetical protein